MPIAYPVTDSLPIPATATSSKWNVTTNTTVLNTPHIYSTYDKNNTQWLVSPVIDLTATHPAETVVLQWGWW